ncbi:hypothetical protein MML48_1g01451 [Holotrichia oblita]|uniref:Uncharacterized protein n=1 Tax=Holotrichia oblita TaxID=644536 RepID=A0ACB9TUZ2_HOLOL|nr:hypothetical protein MML48_1g01451 [Holotrichia oblita]
MNNKYEHISYFTASYINVCSRSDPNISKCWQKTVQELQPYLIKGIPEFNIPPVEPFIVESLRLSQGNSPTVNFEANLTNLNFYGGGNYYVPYANANLLESKVVNLGLTFPRLNATGKYIARGRVLLFQFEGEGTFKGEFSDVKMNGTWYFKIIEKKGAEYFIIDKETIDVEVAGSIVIQLEDLFRGNPQLTKNVNNAINENIDALYTDFKPLLTTTLSTVSRSYFNRVFELFPYDVLLPK